MIGVPLPRLEDRRLVTGQGRYTDDWRLDDQVYAVFVRSPHAHAVLRDIDVSAAVACPGVLAVLTGADYVADGFQGIQHVPNPADAVQWRLPAFRADGIFNQLHLPLPVDKVRHVGEPVAMVIATSLADARDAAEQVMVDYDPLDAVVDADVALEADAPQLWEGAAGNLCFQVTQGDRDAVAAIFRDAPHVVRREFRNSRLVGCQMEPRAALGVYDPQRDHYTLISGSQGAHRQKACVVGALRTTPGQVRVVCPDVGGGFGPRTMLYVEQLAVVWAARRVGRPVKWTGDRSESFVSDYQGRDQIIRAAYAFDRDGRILAIDNEWIGNVGAHTVSYVPMANGTRIMTTVYDVPAVAVRVSGVLTNTVPTAPYRGAGRPEAHHVMERMLDIAARELGVDRVAIRRRNLVREDQLPYLSPMGLTYDSGEFEQNMDRALALADWDGFEARRAASRARGRLRGIGLANYVEGPVGAPREWLRLSVQADGVVDIVAGTQTQGQGHATTFAQVVAAELGVPVQSVRLRTGDTDQEKLGGGSHSDRTMRIAGTLLVQAAAQIRAQGQPVAARLLDVPADTLDFEAGAYVHAPTGRSLSLFSLADQLTEDERAVLSAEAEFEGRMPAHPTGAALCELEVDPETGDVHLLHHVSVDDVGQPINPLILEGQVHGGLAQGIGQALSEGYHMDRESGQVMSGSYMDYGVPRAGSVPPLSLAFTESPTAGNPLRVKGGGESGITPATAVIFNALADALRDCGHDELPMPATPARIWQYIHRAEAGQHAS